MFASISCSAIDFVVQLKEENRDGERKRDRQTIYEVFVKTLLPNVCAGMISANNSTSCFALGGLSELDLDARATIQITFGVHGKLSSWEKFFDYPRIKEFSS